MSHCQHNLPTYLPLQFSLTTSFPPFPCPFATIYYLFHLSLRLTGLAAARWRPGHKQSVMWTMDLDKYTTNAEIPRNTFFHPVKCEAEEWAMHIAGLRKQPRKDSSCLAILISGQLHRVRIWLSCLAMGRVTLRCGVLRGVASRRVSSRGVAWRCFS